MKMRGLKKISVKVLNLYVDLLDLLFQF